MKRHLNGESGRQDAPVSAELSEADVCDTT